MGYKRRLKAGGPASTNRKSNSDTLSSELLADISWRRIRQRERHNRNTYDPKTTWEAYKGLITAINIRVALLNAITAQIAPNNLPSIQGRLIHTNRDGGGQHRQIFCETEKWREGKVIQSGNSSNTVVWQTAASLSTRQQKGKPLAVRRDASLASTCCLCTRRSCSRPLCKTRKKMLIKRGDRRPRAPMPPISRQTSTWGVERHFRRPDKGISAMQ